MTAGDRNEDDRTQIEHQMRKFGWKPKTSAVVRDGRWLLVYENPFAPMSRRYWIGVFEGTTELYRHNYPSDLKARIDFEKRAEAEAEDES